MPFPRSRSGGLLGAIAVSLTLAACAQPAAPPPAAATPAAASAPAASAPSVADLRGARGSSGESVLTERGYSAARTQGLTAYWWHPAGACVRVVTAQGRYSVVESAPAASCGR